ncbi:hypothetical protein L195_g033880, partial [Trifolium pratense]
AFSPTTKGIPLADRRTRPKQAIDGVDTLIDGLVPTSGLYTSLIQRTPACAKSSPHSSQLKRSTTRRRSTLIEVRSVAPTVGKDDLLAEVKALKEKLTELEGELKAAFEKTSILEEEASYIDPTIEFVGMSREALIARIFEVDSSMLDIAKANFDNTMAQIKCQNQDVELVTEDMNKMKEVNDDVLASPSPDGENV